MIGVIMFKISEIKRQAEVRKIREKKKVVTEYKFNLNEVESQKAVEVNTVNLENLVFLQELNSQHQQLLEGFNHAQLMLANLEHFREILLQNKYDINAIKQLQQLMHNLREKTDDITLEAIIDEIELRAEVEIAKELRKMSSQ